MTPKTEAGRRLFTLMSQRTAKVTRATVAAIEAEAASRALAEVRERVEALPGWRDPRYSGQYELPGLVHRDDVLAALEDSDAT